MAKGDFPRDHCVRSSQDGRSGRISSQGVNPDKVVKAKVRKEDPIKQLDSFLQSLVKFAEIFKKNDALNLLTGLIANILNADDPSKFYKVVKKRKDAHNINTSDFALKYQDSFSSKIKKNDKKLESASNRKKQKCILCMRKTLRIHYHYLVQHKIDFPVWIKTISEKEKQGYNNTTCLQCNVEYNDVPALITHLIKYHNVKVDVNLKKRLDELQRNKYVNEIFDKKKTVKNAHLTEG